MQALICDAIRDRVLLELRYHGFARIVEPYAYGRDRDGDELLRCYQVAGGSRGGEEAGWKLLRVAEIGALARTAKPFAGRRSGNRHGDPAMAEIFCELQ